MKTEQNKLEREFAKKLNSREINPSPAAWDRLDAMLTVAEDKKPVRKLNWLYIAAGFIGFILMLSVFLTQTGKVNQAEDAVVIEDHTNLPGGNTSDIIADSLQQSLPAEPTIERVADHTVKKENTGRQLNHTKEPAEVLQNKSSDQIADNTDQKPSDVENSAPGTFIPNPDLPKVDVDQLLADAEKASPKIASKPSVTIDPNSLLSQVDGELELSFREKVIKSVSKNYKNVKVALANRNIEK